MNHIEQRLSGDSWAAIADLLGGGRDLDGWAREFGALERSRKIRDAQSLLRLALVYGGCGKSLKQTCLWSASQGGADLSDEALLKRLGKAGPWIEDILGKLLARRADGGRLTVSKSLRLVDGTTLSAPGDTRPGWRIVLTFDPARQTMVGLDITPASVGEQLSRAVAGEGDLVIGDRGFAHPGGLVELRRRGADFIVRLGSRSLRLLCPKTGHILDRGTLLKKAKSQGGLDCPVQIGHSRSPGWAPLPARIVAVPLPPDAAAANKVKLARAGQREQYLPSATAYAATGWLLLVTSLSADDFPAESLADLYRVRWQIELAIKRLKSLGHLDRLPAQSLGLARTWIAANLLVSMLVEDLGAQVLDSPPSGPHSDASPSLSLAAVA